MGISIGLVGLGQFGVAFVDLFRTHPLVDRIALCDYEPEKIKAVAERPQWQADPTFDPADTYTSLDDILASDLDALAVITQPWLHAPQCVAAMEAGKHVYSAVPLIMLPDGDETLDWCARIIDTTRRTGHHYMLGETTVYHPETMFCRRMAAEGRFGRFVYAEGEYMHDVDAGCNLREVYEKRHSGAAGQAWLTEKKARYAGVRGGPMHYPTHSVSGPVAVMGTRAVKVTAYGYANANDDPFFAQDAFSNEVALFEMGNGATVRICEFREVAGSFHASETFRIAGTSGLYAERTWKENHRTAWDTAQKLEYSTLTDAEMRDPLPEEVALAFKRIEDPDATDASDFTAGGHGGSHPYLVHEFVSAVAADRVPAVSAWEAAKYMAMGVTAHKSALRDGERLDVPDLGEAT
jgi:predicted dehydrogenase